MVQNILLILLLTAISCEAAKIKVRNHTDQPVKIHVLVVGIPIKDKILKPGKRITIDTLKEAGATQYRGIKVQTVDGERKGESIDIGYPCENFVRQKTIDGKTYDLEYYVCPLNRGGLLGTEYGAFYDIFLPSQGKYRTYKTVGKTTHFDDKEIEDTGKNLIVAHRGGRTY
jgi:hypothetical protein